MSKTENNNKTKDEPIDKQDKLEDSTIFKEKEQKQIEINNSQETKNEKKEIEINENKSSSIINQSISKKDSLYNSVENIESNSRSTNYTLESNDIKKENSMSHQISEEALLNITNPSRQTMVDGSLYSNKDEINHIFCNPNASGILPLYINTMISSSTQQGLTPIVNENNSWHHQEDRNIDLHVNITNNKNFNKYENFTGTIQHAISNNNNSSMHIIDHDSISNIYYEGNDLYVQSGLATATTKVNNSTSDIGSISVIPYPYEDQNTNTNKKIIFKEINESVKQKEKEEKKKENDANNEMDFQLNSSFSSKDNAIINTTNVSEYVDFKSYEKGDIVFINSPAGNIHVPSSFDEMKQTSIISSNSYNKYPYSTTNLGNFNSVSLIAQSGDSLILPKGEKLKMFSNITSVENSVIDGCTISNINCNTGSGNSQLLNNEPADIDNINTSNSINNLLIVQNTTTDSVMNHNIIHNNSTSNNVNTQNSIVENKNITQEHISDVVDNLINSNVNKSFCESTIRHSFVDEDILTQRKAFPINIEPNESEIHTLEDENFINKETINNQPLEDESQINPNNAFCFASTFYSDITSPNISRQQLGGFGASTLATNVINATYTSNITGSEFSEIVVCNTPSSSSLIPIKQLNQSNVNNTNNSSKEFSLQNQVKSENQNITNIKKTNPVISQKHSKKEQNLEISEKQSQHKNKNKSKAKNNHKKDKKHSSKKTKDNDKIVSALMALIESNNRLANMLAKHLETNNKKNKTKKHSLKKKEISSDFSSNTLTSISTSLTSNDKDISYESSISVTSESKNSDTPSQETDESLEHMSTSNDISRKQTSSSNINESLNDFDENKSQLKQKSLKKTIEFVGTDISKIVDPSSKTNLTETKSHINASSMIEQCDWKNGSFAGRLNYRNISISPKCFENKISIRETNNNDQRDFDYIRVSSITKSNENENKKSKSSKIGSPKSNNAVINILTNTSSSYNNSISHSASPSNTSNIVTIHAQCYNTKNNNEKIDNNQIENAFITTTINDDTLIKKSINSTLISYIGNKYENETNMMEGNQVDRNAISNISMIEVKTTKITKDEITASSASAKNNISSINVYSTHSITHNDLNGSKAEDDITGEVENLLNESIGISSKNEDIDIVDVSKEIDQTEDDLQKSSIAQNEIIGMPIPQLIPIRSISKSGLYETYSTSPKETRLLKNVSHINNILGNERHILSTSGIDSFNQTNIPDISTISFKTTNPIAEASVLACMKSHSAKSQESVISGKATSQFNGFQQTNRITNQKEKNISADSSPIENENLQIKTQEINENDKTVSENINENSDTNGKYKFNNEDGSD